MKKKKASINRKKVDQIIEALEEVDRSCTTCEYYTLYVKRFSMEVESIKMVIPTKCRQCLKSSYRKMWKLKEKKDVINIVIQKSRQCGVKAAQLLIEHMRESIKNKKIYDPRDTFELMKKMVDFNSYQFKRAMLEDLRNSSS